MQRLSAAVKQLPLCSTAKERHQHQRHVHPECLGHSCPVETTQQQLNNDSLKPYLDAGGRPRFSLSRMKSSQPGRKIRMVNNL